MQTNKISKNEAPTLPVKNEKKQQAKVSQIIEYPTINHKGLSCCGKKPPARPPKVVDNEDVPPPALPPRSNNTLNRPVLSQGKPPLPPTSSQVYKCASFITYLFVKRKFVEVNLFQDAFNYFTLVVEINIQINEG